MRASAGAAAMGRRPGYPPRVDDARPVEVTQTPFGRLVRAHAASIAGDAFVTVSLAGSLFFTVPTASARPKVLLYLALTMLPFAVVAPLLGPVIDRTRGGRRTMLAIMLALRAGLCVLMMRDLDSLLLFPEAFLVLVCSKSAGVIKSALVPALVPDQGRLVEANARLGVVSAVAGAAAGIPAAGLFKLFGSGIAPLVVGCGVFAFGTWLALQIPRAERVSAEPTPEAREELRLPSVVLASWAQASLRFGVGFLTFLVAFTLKRSSPITFGFVIALAGIGSLVGTVLAPPLRRRIREETILIASSVATAAIALLAARAAGVLGLGIAAFFVAVGSSTGKQAFDSIVQRDAPDALRGRTFARFEMLFQVAWVVGGLIPVIFATAMDARLGLFLLAITLGAGAVVYGSGLYARPSRPPLEDSGS